MECGYQAYNPLKKSQKNPEVAEKYSVPSSIHETPINDEMS